MSARAPAGRTTKNTGTAAAACTRLTINGEVESCVISQPAPTFCIQVPVYEITAAIHNDRNSGSRNGAQGESARRVPSPQPPESKYDQPIELILYVISVPSVVKVCS